MKKTDFMKVIGRPYGYRIRPALTPGKLPHLKQEITYLDFTGKR